MASEHIMRAEMCNIDITSRQQLKVRKSESNWFQESANIEFFPSHRSFRMSLCCHAMLIDFLFMKILPSRTSRFLWSMRGVWRHEGWILRLKLQVWELMRIFVVCSFKFLNFLNFHRGKEKNLNFLRNLFIFCLF